ncbi:MAG: glycerate kinase type-2 family protein [Promethearchaeota archaeon]
MSFTFVTSHKEQLIKGTRDSWCRDGRNLLIDLLEKSINLVDPVKAIKKHVMLEDDNLVFIASKNERVTFNLKYFKNIHIIGAGKATLSMAIAIEDILGERITDGAINVPEALKIKNEKQLSKIKVFAAGHPLPTHGGLEGARRILDICEASTMNDLVICLISGGGSALLPAPATGISIDDLKILNKLLVDCGANINEINTVRKHVSLVKGGQLARAASPATIVSLILSDVVGDDMSTIASGPTVPDNTTFSDAITIINKYNILEAIPATILEHLNSGKDGKKEETPKPGDPIFSNVNNIIIGSASIAADGIKKIVDENEALKTFAHVVSTMVHGEAYLVGSCLAKIIESIHLSRESFSLKCDGTFLENASISIENDGALPEYQALLIFTGETTVTLKGSGIGGRNQELLLSFLNAIGSKDIGKFVILSCGMDGIEGNSPAAGAIIDSSTTLKMKERDLDAGSYLENNDSHSFFKILGDAIITGPTGTNVNDITLVLLRKPIKTFRIID